MKKSELVDHINEYGETVKDLSSLEDMLRRDNPKIYKKLDEFTKRKSELCKLIKSQMDFGSIVQGEEWEAVSVPVRVLDPRKVRKQFKSEKVFLDFVTVKIKDLSRVMDEETINKCADSNSQESKVLIQQIKREVK